jgi:ABC-type branched-subunit amino acid transport system ATPase component
MSSPKLLMVDELSLGPAPKTTDHLGAALRQIMTKGLSLPLVEQESLAHSSSPTLSDRFRDASG